MGVGGEEGAEGGGAEGVAGECCERSLFSGDVHSLGVSLEGVEFKGGKGRAYHRYSHTTNLSLSTPRPAAH